MQCSSCSGFFFRITLDGTFNTFLLVLAEEEEEEEALHRSNRREQ